LAIYVLIASPTSLQQIFALLEAILRPPHSIPAYGHQVSRRYHGQPTDVSGFQPTLSWRLEQGANDIVMEADKPTLQNQLGHHPRDDASIEKDPFRRPSSPNGRARAIHRLEPHHHRHVPLHPVKDQLQKRFFPPSSFSPSTSSPPTSN